jgi:hypothetical protein
VEAKISENGNFRENKDVRRKLTLIYKKFNNFWAKKISQKLSQKGKFS